MTRKRWLIVAAVAAALGLWLWLRKSSQVGHATPDDAMAWGWAVFPRGITGWREVGPGGEIVDHDTGGENVPGEGVAPS